MRLSIPKWAGMVEAAAWLVLSVFLAWTTLGLVSLVGRASAGTFVFGGVLRGRSLAEIPWIPVFSSLPAIIGLLVAVFAQGATLARQRWLVRIAAWNLVASMALSLIG